MLPGRDANAHRTLIALYLLTSQAPIKGLVIGSLVRALQTFLQLIQYQLSA